jgi:hypothetical protein
MSSKRFVFTDHGNEGNFNTTPGGWGQGRMPKKSAMAEEAYVFPKCQRLNRIRKKVFAADGSLIYLTQISTSHAALRAGAAWDGMRFLVVSSLKGNTACSIIQLLSHCFGFFFVLSKVGNF